LRLAYLFDKSVSHEQTAAGNFPALVVHRYQYCRITDEESGHMIKGSPNLMGGYAVVISTHPQLIRLPLV
jgi:hypothetical protein